MKIKINNDLWEVKPIEGSKKKMNPDKNHCNLGLCEYLDLRINIRKGMAESVTRSTIIHELIHAFLFSYGCDVQEEEQMCDFFGAHGERILELTERIMQEVREDAEKGRDLKADQ